MRVLHLVDAATPDDGLALLGLLLRRMPREHVEQRVLALGVPPRQLDLPPDTLSRHVGRRFGTLPASAVDVGRALRELEPDLVHALSGSAAAPIRAAELASRTQAAALITTLCDPAQARDASKWWRSLGPSGAGRIVCASGTIQRRAVEAGLPVDATAVIRPGVDFAELRRAAPSARRADLGLPETGRVLLASWPPSRAGGQFYAVWAMAMLHQIWPDAGLVVPGPFGPGSRRELRRLQRLAGRIYCSHAYYFTESRVAPAVLLAVADMLVAPAVADVPTGAVALAMAAGVPVVGSAVPAIAELIADRENGFLCRPGEPHTLAVRIRAAAESPRLHTCVEAARGQAYDAFRAQQCVENYLRLFRELSSGPRATVGGQFASGPGLARDPRGGSGLLRLES